MINFIPNDPLAVDILPMRTVAARPPRPSGRAGITVAGNAAEAVYKTDEAGFLQWQTRQTAILTLEAWEEALGAPIASWAQESANAKSLLVIPDDGEDINAYYDRQSVSFFHKLRDGETVFSGASADVVSHEVGHAILDALRPDFWSSMQLEVGGFHEAFGDITAIVTALSDRSTREKLLEITPDLSSANFVESTAEDLSDTIRRVLGAKHPASKPRQALNTFTWQLPETMPRRGGPDDMIGEVHSIARIMSGCFYDVIRAMFAAAPSHGQAQLWAVTRTAARLFYEAAKNAPQVPRFYRSLGRSVVLADGALNGGANSQLIGQAFFSHGLALGANAFLAPEFALAGDSPVYGRAGGVTLKASTMRDLRGRIGAPAGARMTVSLVQLGDVPVAKVTTHAQVPLDDVDPRLAGVVAPVNSEALVGESGGSAALLFAPRAGSSTTEVLDFVHSLVQNDQVAFDAPKKRRGAAASESYGGTTTHAIGRRGGKKELQRTRFTCHTHTEGQD